MWIMQKHNYCRVCNIRLDKLQRPQYQQIKSASLIEKLRNTTNTLIAFDDYICKKCITSSQRASQKQSLEETANESNNEIAFQDIALEEYEAYNDPEYNITINKDINNNDLSKPEVVNSLCLNFSRSSASHKSCVICKRSNRYQKLTIISIDAIVHAFAETNILIPQGTRCCLTHLEDSGLLNADSFIQLTPAKNNILMNQSHIEVLLKNFRLAFKHSTLFDRFACCTSLNDNICLRNTGLTKDQFIIMLNALEKMRNTTERTKSQALAIFLFWLKTGLDQLTIESYFNVPSQQDISRYCEQVREALYDGFVIDNIGAKQLERDEWLTHNSYIAKELFTTHNDQLILIADGTYCYIQKSRNNYFQRKTYSLQKKRHLVKPFVICTSDGYIVDIYGLYPATDNDATILQHIFESDVNLTMILKPNDIFILDRGFRDCLQTLKKDYELITKVPHFLRKNQEQLTTEQANQSRLVTKSRWVVEAINTFLKNSFRALNNVKNKSLKHTFKDYKIAGAMINKFFRRLFSDSDNQQKIVANMKKQLTKKNTLKAIVSKMNINKQFKPLEGSEIVDFPKFDEDEIKTEVTTGTYQLKQALSYIAEHLDENSMFQISISESNEVAHSSKKFTKKSNAIHNPSKTSKLLFANIQSRHSKTVKYKVFIRYVPNKNSFEGITDWYCNCKNGSRTLGCCSHIACIIYYLSFGQYQEKLPNPAGNLQNIFPTAFVIEDSSDEEITENEDDDDSDDNDDGELLENNLKLRNDDEQINNRIKHSLSFNNDIESSKKKLKSDDSDKILHNNNND